MRLALVCGVAAAALVSVPASEACGDKFIVLGRSLKKVPRAPRPATVLLLGAKGSQFEASARELRLEGVLKQAGHVVVRVEDASAARVALASRAFELVLADASETQAASEAVRAAASRAVVIPVVHKPRDADRAAAEAAFGYVVVSPDRKLAYLGVLDRAIARSHSAAAAASR